MAAMAGMFLAGDKTFTSLGVGAILVVAVRARDVAALRVRTAIAQLEREAVATGTMNAPADVTVNPDRTVASVAIPMKGDGTDAISTRAVDALRDDVVPATIGHVPGT